MVMRVLDIEEELNGIVKDFRETIRKLRMERAVMMLTLQRIALDSRTDGGKLARETLSKLEEITEKGSAGNERA